MCVLHPSLQSVQLKNFGIINIHEAKFNMCGETHVGVHGECLALSHSCKKKDTGMGQQISVQFPYITFYKNIYREVFE